MEASGLGVTLDRCTFDNFRVEAPWQKNMRDTAWAYVENHGSDWLYMGGQPGCGKTHLCTAVCGALLNRGVPVRYMLWADQVQRIKAGINDSDVLDELLEPLKTIPVLYIDDLFKSQNTNGKPSPTPADVRLAFEIFNARYVRGLPTIISCEWDLMDLLDTDQGTFSRVYERCKRFCVQVSADRARNYRLNGG
jgi:DNA replication protein DnaC